MKLLKEIKEIKTDEKSLKSFGLIVGAIFSAIGVWTALRCGAWFNGASVLGGGLIILGAAAPNVLKHFFIVWMTLGILIGAITAPILFFIFYLIAFVPTAILSRICGKKFLDFSFSREQKSYWIAKTLKQDERRRAENQF